MNGNDIARIKELYFQHPEYSARTIARKLLMSTYDVLPVMRKMGYSAEAHEKARQAVLKGEKPQSPMKMAAKPKVEKTPVCAISFDCSHVPSPDTIESKKEKALLKKANLLLQKAEKAANEGDLDNYLKFRKEYEVAERQAQAYKMRGHLNQTEKEISAIEQQYHICR